MVCLSDNKVLTAPNMEHLQYMCSPPIFPPFSHQGYNVRDLQFAFLADETLPKRVYFPFKLTPNENLKREEKNENG